MKNLKLLSFVLLCGTLVLAGCEKANNQEKLSCDGDEVCSVEDVVENGGIIINDTPSVIVDENDEFDVNGGGEIMNEEVVDNEQVGEEGLEEPLMRKMVVDEDATSEEIEISVSETCEALGGSWTDGTCTLQDGSVVYF